MNEIPVGGQPESWAILEQALYDGAFEAAGFNDSPLRVFGEYTVAWNTAGDQVAIADSGGWWTMDARQLKAIVDAGPESVPPKGTK